MSFAFLQLTAQHPEKVVCRYYELEVTRDLIGDWVLATYFGDCGKPGRYRQYGFNSFDKLLNKLLFLLRQRFNVQRNQGYRYTITSLYLQEGVKVIEEIIKDAYAREAGSPSRRKF